MTDPRPKVIVCPPPQRVNIRIRGRQVVWSCPRGQVLNIVGLPSQYFTGGRRVGNNYRWTFNGKAPEGSVWPYKIVVSKEAKDLIRDENPELTNVGG